MDHQTYPVTRPRASIQRCFVTRWGALAIIASTAVHQVMVAMQSHEALFGITCACFVFQWALRRLWRRGAGHYSADDLDEMVLGLSPLALQLFPEAGAAMAELSLLYGRYSSSAFHIQVDGRRARRQVAEATGDAAGAVYGEILPQSVVNMLAQVGARPGMHCFDLGSGTGKTVLMAGLLGLRATGVELVEQRWTAACAALRQLDRSKFGTAACPTVAFQRRSFLDANFLSSDILFVNSLLFSNSTMEVVALQARCLKPGSIVITHRGLPGPWFQRAGSFVGGATWTEEQAWLIQTVTESDGLDRVACHASRPNSEKAPGKLSEERMCRSAALVQAGFPEQ